MDHSDSDQGDFSGSDVQMNSADSEHMHSSDDGHNSGLSDTSDLVLDSDSDSDSDSNSDSDLGTEFGYGSDLDFTLGFDESDSDDEASTEDDPEPLDQNLVDDSDELHQNFSFFDTPQPLKALRNDLLGTYKCPSNETEANLYVKPLFSALSLSQNLSLRMYIAWVKTNGTSEAHITYKETIEQSFRDIKAMHPDFPEIDFLTRHQSRKLAAELTSFAPKFIDMCSKSCIAYTGKYKFLELCPTCNAPRYKESSSEKKKRVPEAQLQTLPVKSTIMAMYANAETSNHMRYRSNTLREALKVIGQARYSDYANSQIHRLQYDPKNFNLFQDDRDVAFALSSDGAQLTMKKKSNTWILILIILNLPPDMRYKSNNIIINMAIPGPNSPGDLESFLRPLYEEMAEASEGYWMYDAVASSNFINKAYISLVLGDMPGSAKLNGMAGHSAIFGDRFTLVQAARSSLKPGSKSQYYPMNPGYKSEYNPTRPDSYDLAHLPIRTQSNYWKIIKTLDAAKTDADKAKITKTTGVKHLPLAAASKVFVHPVHFPVDPFHLLYENNMKYIWELWISSDTIGEIIHFSRAKELGALIPEAMKTLPPTFCGPVRDPYLKHSSQYKIYEWMALLHWYIVPMGIDLGMNAEVLKNFSVFSEIAEYAMTPKARSEEDLQYLQGLVILFLKGFEDLYVQKDSDKISRMRLCVFQLVHIPHHIRWNGSIRMGSQAAMERTVGYLSRKLHSKKSPFVELSNKIYRKELIRILCLHYPEFTIPAKPIVQKRLLQKHKALNKAKNKSDVEKELHVLSALTGFNLVYTYSSDADIKWNRWGRARIPSGMMLSSQLGDSSRRPPRKSIWFEARGKGDPEDVSKFIFGEAIAFYQLEIKSKDSDVYVIYKPLINIQKILSCIAGSWREGGMLALNIKEILGLVGIWKGKRELTYILRKHPGINMLEESGFGSEGSKQDQES